MGQSLTKSKPLIVELVGLPGAGKTTLSKQLVSKFKERGLQVIFRDKILHQWHQKNPWQKLMQLLPHNFNHWNILINSLIFALQVKPINRQSFSKAIKIFTNAKRNDTVFQSSDCDLILLDQGLLQETWSVSVTGSPPATKYLKQEITLLFHNRPTIVLHCQIDIDTALSRVQNRQTMTSRFDLMDANQAHSILEKYSLYLDEIVSCARINKIPILEIDSSRSIAEQSEKAIGWIESQLTQLAIVPY